MSNYSFSEAELRLKYVNDLSYDNTYDTFLEVPVFCRSVDLVLHDKTKDIISAIEFKLYDWKKAIKQIQSIKICFDYLWICLPKPKTPNGETKVIESCRNNNIGLIWYDIAENSFITQLQCPHSTIIWNAQKKQIISYLESQSNE